jgi:hypothetical protein
MMPVNRNTNVKAASSAYFWLSSRKGGDQQAPNVAQSR